MVSATETVRAVTTKSVVCAEEGDVMTEVLGSALVAGALGRKLGDARTATLIKGITECRVEIMSTRQKAKRPVPKAPDNSREADSSIESVCEARMSLSATDLHVRLELPGDVHDESVRETEPRGVEEIVVGKEINEMTSPEPRRVLLTSVRANSGETPSCDIAIEEAPATTAASVIEDDEPATPGLIDTPVTTDDLRARGAPKTPVSAVAVGGTAGGADRDVERRQLTREINVAEALSRRMTEDHPELAVAASFLDTVCGRGVVSKKNQTEKAYAGKVTVATDSRAENAIERTVSTKGVTHPMTAG